MYISIVIFLKIRKTRYSKRIILLMTGCVWSDNIFYIERILTLNVVETMYISTFLQIFFWAHVELENICLFRTLLVLIIAAPWLVFRADTVLVARLMMWIAVFNEKEHAVLYCWNFTTYELVLGMICAVISTATALCERQ